MQPLFNYILVILSVLTFNNALLSQKLMRCCIDVMGNSESSGGLTWQSSTGQSSLVGSLSTKTNLLLRQGFIQGSSKAKLKIRHCDLKVYPTLTSNEISLSFEQDEDDVSDFYHYEILTVNGTKVSSGNITKDIINTIDVSSIKTGIYFLKLESNTCFSSQKFIKID